MATLDTWQFSDERAMTTATEIAEAYQEAFGKNPATGRHILLVRFPQQNVPKGAWEAETRGNTVVLLSSDMAFESQAMQRLSEQFRHELFHLWIPNGVKLTGRYDWFYEGFALYQSLKTGVALNQITFADYLDTLSRAHAIDSANTAGRLSLLEASAARWAGNETQVYARGMVTAFLCDLALLRESNGKRSVETLLRELFAGRRYDDTPEDGNTVVLRILESHTELNPITKQYIRGNTPIDWGALIAAAGLENEPGTPATRLRVSTKLTGKQKTLLDKLGYNSWRKLTK
jgi:predicted metalloprotease with PDZ domain